MLEAEEVFRRDLDEAYFLKSHPNNIWALSGLLRCLEAREGDDDGLQAEMEALRRKLDAMRQNSDVDVQVACLCACTCGGKTTAADE